MADWDNDVGMDMDELAVDCCGVVIFFMVALLSEVIVAGLVTTLDVCRPLVVLLLLLFIVTKLFCDVMLRT